MKYYLTLQDRELLAQVINSFECITAEVYASEIVTIRIQDTVVWVQLFNCWLTFDYKLFKEKIQKFKPPTLKSVKPVRKSPVRKPREVNFIAESPWKEDRGIVWTEKTYEVIGSTGNVYEVLLGRSNKASCNCKGNLIHGHCYHASAVLEHEGLRMSFYHRRTQRNNYEKTAH